MFIIIYNGISLSFSYLKFQSRWHIKLDHHATISSSSKTPKLSSTKHTQIKFCENMKYLIIYKITINFR